MDFRQTVLRSLAAGAALFLFQTSAAAQDSSGVRNVAGRYKVNGITVNQVTGERREITGIISIRQTGDTYRSHSELRTVAPGEHARRAKVVGTGAGKIIGDRLSGSGELQLITSQVPGLDAEFGLAPTAVSSRAIHTSWEGTVQEDGVLQVETVNIAGKGEANYQATHTSLKGKRLSKATP